MEPEGYLNETARGYFRRICAHLESADALEEIDSIGLSMMAMDLWMYHTAADKISEGGYAQETKTGYSQINADFTVMKECKASFLKFSQKFGLSPKDREAMLKFKGRKKTKDALDEI